jgi:hypothetical protein
MRKLGLGVCALVLLAATAVGAAQGVRMIRGLLTGYEEVPAVSTTAEGGFRAEISDRGDEITYELRYRETEGAVTQAHIHVGQRGVNGGISVFLCSNLGNGPAGTQACPPAPATITGTIRPADVSPNIPATAAARAQGVDTGEFDELVRAIRAGATYVNVHTTKFPGGEIRSQIGPGQGGGKGRGKDDDHGNH